MKFLTEYRSKDEPKTLEAISTYGLSLKDFKQGEAVGIYLSELYPDTILLIERLLSSYTKEYYKNNKLVKVHYRAHPVTLKYEGKLYILHTIDEWKHTYQDPKDQIKTKTDRHPILEAYLEKRKAYIETKQALKQKERFYILYKEYPELEQLSDEVLDTLITSYSKAYDCYPDSDNRYDKLLTYIQIKYYIDNNIEPLRDLEELGIISVGDETYLEDINNKLSNNVDKLLKLCYNTIERD